MPKTRGELPPSMRTRLANERTYVSSRLVLAYSYPEWVQEGRYPEGYNVSTFDEYNDGFPRRHLVIFLALCDKTVFSQALLLEYYPFLSQCDGGHCFFKLPRQCIADWDVMANSFYRTFYTPQPYSLRCQSLWWRNRQRIRDVSISNTSRENMDDLINVLLQFKPLPHFGRWTCIQKKCTSLLSHQRMSSDIRNLQRAYWPLQQLQRFKRQCEIIIENETLIQSSSHYPWEKLLMIGIVQSMEWQSRHG